jgi:response regulator RpfG family c-di-GMP phosphodiesterase
MGMRRNQDVKILSEVTNRIQEVKDIDLLLEEILTRLRRFFGADAGSIYLREGDVLRFSYAQNDTLESRLPPGQKLIYKLFTIPINQNSIAGYVAKEGIVLNIPNVYKMPQDKPYKFDYHFDEISNYKTQSMITVPMLNQRGIAIGVVQLINRKDRNGKVLPFTKENEELLKTVCATLAFAVERAQLTREIVMKMIKMAELRDPKETGSHVNRVGGYSLVLYQEWARNKGIPEEQIRREGDTFKIAAMLHDVGKVAISDVILKKPAKLSEEEYQVMKTHTFLGARLFADPKSEFEQAALEVALNHHERWDGKGYPGHVDIMTGLPLPGYEMPDGSPKPKKGEEIPIFGRIVAIADVYDALLSKRVYKEDWDEDKAVEEIKSCSGQNFDPELVEIFLSCLPTFRQIRERYPH